MVLGPGIIGSFIDITPVFVGVIGGMESDNGVFYSGGDWFKPSKPKSFACQKTPPLAVRSSSPMTLLPYHDGCVYGPGIGIWWLP